MGHNLKRMSAYLIIPAYNEAKAIKKVLQEVPKDTFVEIIVVDNNSTDHTAKIAQSAGATVLREVEQGYGAACLKGIQYVVNKGLPVKLIAFVDGDYADYPSYLSQIIQPIVDNRADLVIGSRAMGESERGSMTFPQRFGNWLATSLIQFFWKEKFTDLGPMRAIAYDKLLEINMKDRNYGWTVEMQIKAAQYPLRCLELPVPYRKRLGVSKVSGTIKGSFMAGYKILYTIFKYL